MRARVAYQTQVVVTLDDGRDVTLYQHRAKDWQATADAVAIVAAINQGSYAVAQATEGEIAQEVNADRESAPFGPELPAPWEVQ